MKTNSVNPKEDIQAIREIMERSSKFMLLNSWAGFFAGACALIGAALAWFVILDSGSIYYEEFLHSVGGSPINKKGLPCAFCKAEAISLRSSWTLVSGISTLGLKKGLSLGIPAISYPRCP